MIWLYMFALLLFRSICSHWHAEFVYAFWFCFYLSLCMLECNSKAFKKGRMVLGLEHSNRILETSGLSVMLPQPSSVILGRLLSLWLILLLCKRDIKILSPWRVVYQKYRKEKYKEIDFVRAKIYPTVLQPWGKGCWNLSLNSAVS